MSALPALTPDLSGRIDTHLQQSYRGIFTPAAIETHLREYVSGNEAASFWAQIKVLLARPDMKILDVGSGYGAFVLTARRNGYNAQGLELAAFDNNCARERLAQMEPQTDPDSVFTEGSALSLPYLDETFDIVTFWNVVEHLPDYRLALREASRVLKKGGYIVIEAPNYAAFRNEAHYHVPWLPFLPKKIAAAYLRRLGRDPSFLNNDIYYCSLWGVAATLKRCGCDVSTLLHEKLLDPAHIARPELRRAMEKASALGLRPLLRAALNVKQFFPAKSSIQCVGRKK